MLTPTKVGRQPTVADLFHARKTANLACGHAIDMSHGEGEIIERDQRERANRIAADWSLLDDEQRKEDAKRVHDRECLFARRGDPRAEDDKGRPCD